MAGFKFEVGIKKGIRTIQKPALLQARQNLLEDWAHEVQTEAKKQARLPASGTIYGKGSVSGRLANSIVVSKPTSSASGRSISMLVYVDETQTKTQHTPGVGKTPIDTSYARFQEYGTGIWSEDPRSPKMLIIAKNKQYMTWIQHGKAYRGNYIHAYSVAGFETKNLKRPRLIQKRHGGPERSKYQKSYHRRMSGGPWKQIATLVQGVRPKRYMRTALNDPGIKQWYKNEQAIIKKAYEAAFKGS